MIKKIRRIIAVTLAFSICLTALFCGFTTLANTPNKNIVNVLSGLTPTAFMAVADGGITYDWTAMRGPNAEYGWEGYDKSSTRQDVSVTKYERWAEYVTKLTDGNTEESFLLRAVDVANKDILITYEIEESDLSGFSMEGIECTSIDVYVSDAYATLFDTVKTTVIPNENKAEVEFTTEKTKFIGFRLNGCNSYIREIEVYGITDTSIPNPLPMKKNVLSGLTPTAFMAVADGGITYDWTAMRGPNAEYGWEGYDKSSTRQDVSVTKYERWAEYVTKLTDGNTEESFLLRAVDVANKDILITYEIEESDLSGFSMEGIECTSIDVYVSDAYVTLFDTVKTTVIPNENKAEVEFTTEKTKFIGFRLNGCNSYIREIEVYSVPVVEQENIVSGTEPMAFMAVGDGAKAFDWTLMRGANAEFGWYGYDKTSEHGTYGNGGLAYNQWKPYMAMITDGNTTDSFLVRGEDTSKDVLIVFELADEFSLNGFKIYGVSGTVDVYASDTYATLFDTVSTTVTASEDSATASLSIGSAKFVGFRLNACNCYIKEIEVYGKESVPGEEDDKEEDEVVDYENSLIGGVLPSAYYTASSGKTEYSWHDLSGTGGNLKGYDRHNSRGDISNTFFNNWKEKVQLFTNGKSGQGLLVKPENNYSKHGGTYEDVLIVYELPETATLTGFEIRTSAVNSAYPSFASVQVYISRSRETLFEQNPVAATEENDKYTGTLSGDGILYVGFRLKESDCRIKEILVYGEFKEYVRPNYGKNLIAGKLPMSFFIAEREYPLSLTGDKIYKVEQERSQEVSLYTLTDNDFTKSFSWDHQNNSTYVNKDSRYKVLAYDLGSVSKIDKILIDSQAGGYDIFVSSDYNKLFLPEETRVYTSNGDKLLLDGSALDPSTDLITGENLIELTDVEGRYVGIVITRGSRLDKAISEAVYMSEIQIYGEAGNSNYGDNLIKGKTPIFNYRAKYGEYGVSLGETFVQGDGATVFTDGAFDKSTKMIMPSNEGMINYSYGANVMIYYLEGTCDINAFSMYSFYYYAPGGLDVYVSNSFNSLFDKDSCVFTTGGETATEGVYDKTKDLGAVSVSASLQTPKEGRYVAFVITRFHDSVNDGWGQLQLRELEIFGNMKKTESLPSTTIVDEKNGASIEFIYKNPDETYLFAEKGIKTFRLKSVDTKEYTNPTFNAALKENGYNIVGDAFNIEFLDSKGNVVSKDKLLDMNAIIKLRITDDRIINLAEIRNDCIYIVKVAEKIGDIFTYRTDQFDKLLAFVKFDENSYLNKSELGVVEVQKNANEQIISPDNENQFDDYIKDNSNELLVGDFESDSTISNDSTVGNINNTDDVNNGSNSEPKKQWVVVEVDDPLEWFWNIYDTFAANIWMLIVTSLSLAIGISAVIIVISYTKKRRKI